MLDLSMPHNIHILWASWNIASLLGWGMGAVLIHFSCSDQAIPAWVLHPIAPSMLA